MDRGTRQRLAGLTVALVLVTPLSVIAARWQWNRHLERDALNAAVIRAESTRPVDWTRLVQDGGVDTASEWRRVTATGTWVPSAQLLVRKQVVDGDVGFTVVTPLRTESGVTLYVLRGWVPSADVAVSTPPTGVVTVMLRVRLPHGDEPIRPDDLPPGQINRVDPATMGTSTVNAVFELLEPVPKDLVALPWPELTSGPHLSYFVQWILIGLTGVVVYIRVFRSEVRLARDGGDDSESGA